MPLLPYVGYPDETNSTSGRAAPIFEALVVLCLFLVTNIACAMFQGMANGDGIIWDAAIYYQMASQFATGSPLTGDAPFIFRIGTPILAAVLQPHDLVLGFKIANVAANFISTMLLAVWLSFFVRNRLIRVFMVAVFVTMFSGPVRFAYFYPVFADNWAYVFILVCFIAIHKARGRVSFRLVASLSMLAFLGVLFREFLVTTALAALFIGNPLKYDGRSLRIVVPRKYLFMFVPLVSSIVATVAIRFVVTPTGIYSFATQVITAATAVSAFRYAHAWFNAYGPVLVLAVYRVRSTLGFLYKHQYLAAYLVMILGITYIGGTNLEKFAEWATPVVLVLIGRALEANVPAIKSLPFIACLIALQGLSQRLIWVLPQHVVEADPSFPLLTLPGNSVPYLQLWALFSTPQLSLTILAEYISVSLLLVFWLLRRESRLHWGRRMPEPALLAIDDSRGERTPYLGIQ